LIISQNYLQAIFCLFKLLLLLDDLNKIERGEQRIKKLIMSNIKSQQSIANGFAGNSSSSSSSGNENNEAVVSSTSSSSSRKIVNLTKYLNSGDFHT
jgi:hypothetical protein